MRIDCLIYFILIISLLPASASYGAKLNCVLLSSASITPEKTGVLGSGEEKLVAESNNSPSDSSLQAIIGEDSLMIIGNNGKSEAIQIGLGGIGKQRYFVETSNTGNKNLWTLHPYDKASSANILISQKSYNFLGWPVSYMSAYKCQ